MFQFKKSDLGRNIQSGGKVYEIYAVNVTGDHAYGFDVTEKEPFDEKGSCKNPKTIHSVDFEDGTISFIGPNYRKINFQLADLLQNLSNAVSDREGDRNFSVQDSSYLDGVKKAIPDMEKALKELKSYIKELEK